MTGSTPRDGRNGRPTGPSGSASAGGAAGGETDHQDPDDDHTPAVSVFMDPATGRALRQQIANDNPANLAGVKRWGLILGLLAVGGAAAYFLVR